MPQVLDPLLLLVCPIGMGLMMWFMMRGGAPRRNDSTPSPAELDELRKEIAELRVHQAPQKERDTPQPSRN